MFIRDDLLNEIKKIFNTEDFYYIQASKTSYNTNSLLFNADGRTIAIEFEKEDTYFMYEVEEEFNCYFIVGPIIQLSITEEETRIELDESYSEFDPMTIRLPGKAFDFTTELVLLAMENW